MVPAKTALNRLDMSRHRLTQQIELPFQHLTTQRCRLGLALGAVVGDSTVQERLIRIIDFEHVLASLSQKYGRGPDASDRRVVTPSRLHKALEDPFLVLLALKEEAVECGTVQVFDTQCVIGWNAVLGVP